MRRVASVLLFCAVWAFNVAPSHAQQTPPPAPSTQDKLNEVTGSLDALGQKVESLKERHWLRDVGPTIVSFLSVLLAAGALWLTYHHNRRSLMEKAREEERKSIREKLDQFYGPFMHLRGLSKNLYSIFLERRPTEDHEQYPGRTGRFATLTALFKGKVFEGVDAVLLGEIIEVGRQSEKIIAEKGGLVDDPELRNMLWKLAAHYRIIDLASKNKLSGGGKEFEDFTFPQQIDEKVEQKVKTLNDRLAELQKFE